MEMQIENYRWPGLTNKCICTILVCLCLPAFGAVQAYDDYQHRMLLNPSAEMLDAEKQGYIMIYDGLENRVVDRAMTEQFDRIENMMFVGTRYLQEDGELLFEEDGCD